MTHDPDAGHLAVIGLACRFPGASDPGEFWADLVGGVDSITRLPARNLPGTDGPGGRYVPAGGFLTRPEWFDAGYFGYSPREARIIDPQHRVFLECAVQALEDAGCDPDRYPGLIGVYAGGTDTDYAAILRSRQAELPAVTNWEIRVATGADFLTSRTAYKLGLRGPAVTVRAACATSLVAVHLAAQALLGGDCDLALAGGACVHVPATPSEYTEGGVISPDGMCRTFDAAARGIVGGDGAGLVVLKRLPDARADGDRIRAVIRGSAVNNDGPDRVGYTAPSVDGQAAVIRAAQLVADVDPRTVTYVEAHGTATPLGDPIEVAALRAAFGDAGGPPGYCALGSVKTNIGHTDAAAGVAGLIKTILALEQRVIPPSLHLTEPNPQIDFTSSPFRVATRPLEWRPDGVPRRAGLSSFGMGGTNAHVILEEAPARPAAVPRPRQLLVLSAMSAAALEAATDRLAAHLREHSDLPPQDVAWTLQTGRRQLPYRRFAVVDGVGDAVAALTGRDPDRVETGPEPARSRKVALVFPAAAGVVTPEAEPEFDLIAAECRAAAGSLSGDLAVFARELALARMWRRWGVTPEAMVGMGAGRLAAAVAAGELSVPHAARRVAGDAPPPDDQVAWPEPGTVLLVVGEASAVRGSGHLVIDGTEGLAAAGRLWLAGVPISWEELQGEFRPVKVGLPTYPFERRRHVVEPRQEAPVAPVPETAEAEGVREVVAGLFSEMLGLAPGDLDPDESFFDLGGDSLVATQVLVRVRKIYSVELALRSMLGAPTLNAFAALVEGRVNGDAWN